ncbi:MAG TPA: DUF4114 domain-containing protein [Vicinamibacteria bacterium]
MPSRVLCLCATILCLGATVQATPHLTPIGSSGEPSLASILDSLYGAGNYVRVDDGADQWWTNLGSAGARAEAKYAGYGQNFGYVDGASAFHSLFTVNANGLMPGGLFSTFTPAESGNPFRWADLANGSASNYWTSYEGDNVDPGTCLATTCVDHMVTFLVTTGASAGSYVIAFEDLRGNQSPDRDFNDLVVEVQGAAPGPEPGMIGLLALGLAALGRRAANSRKEATR